MGQISSISSRQQENINTSSLNPNPNSLTSTGTEIPEDSANPIAIFSPNDLREKSNNTVHSTFATYFWPFQFRFKQTSTSSTDDNKKSILHQIYGYQKDDQNCLPDDDENLLSSSIMMENVSERIRRHIMESCQDAMKCPICLENYSTDEEEKNMPVRLPVKSRECSHSICFDCLKKWHAAKSKGRRRLIACPMCRKNKAFNGENPIIDKQACVLISALTLCDTTSNSIDDHKSKKRSASDALNRPEKQVKLKNN